MNKKKYIIPLSLVVEDALSKALAEKILENSRKRFAVKTVYDRGGVDYIRTKIRAFNKAAKSIPYFVLADLDRYGCAPDLIKDWLASDNKQKNLILRIAVKEAEAWLLADKKNLASYLKINAGLVPEQIESINDPKTILINLARRSTSSKLRSAIVPDVSTRSIIGPDYNGVLTNFVRNFWDIREAQKRSDSLRRAIKAIKKFKPNWQ
ncbi:MAG: DUF4276 family protein [Deltaproteobacteria bacterium]|nr:DUF4276 family protein [Deltaproteobacteria bacterium]